jgi:hypothetical protein
MSRGNSQNEFVGNATTALASASAHQWEVEEGELYL